MSNETVYFFTFHKCASTLFSTYILKNITGLQHIDYADLLYSGEQAVTTELSFKKEGCVYGPIRLSAAPNTPVYQRLIIPTSKHEFIQDKIAVFFVRDPRDILVSSYYSFGFSHGFSSVKEIRNQQKEIRGTIQEKSLDEYVLDSATVQAINFKELYTLFCSCDRSVILKYEHMINDFDYFVTQLCKHINLDEKVIEEMYQRSRPRQKEDRSSHRRSGQVAGYKNALKEETIKSLNNILKDTLTVFQYDL